MPALAPQARDQGQNNFLIILPKIILPFKIFAFFADIVVVGD
jgi:hypothetical protein